VGASLDRLRDDEVDFPDARELALENLALRQQLAVLMRTGGGRRLHLGRWDRLLWVALSRGWPRWRDALAIVEPATVPVAP
jgi:hypothetical protein